MAKHQTPCINVCDFSGPKGWCLGCARTRQEWEGWSKLKPYGRNSLRKQLQKRMSRMKADRPPEDTGQVSVEE